MRGPRALLAIVAAALALAALPASAEASPLWADQAAMQNTTDYLRTSFIIDTGGPVFIPRQLFLTEPYFGLYHSFGFDRNFFTWAPETSVGDAYMANGRAWTGCGGSPGVQEAVPGNWSHCAPGAVKLGSANQMRADVGTGSLSGLVWGDTFVSNVCGNWSPANRAAKPSPEPTISGVKYEDRNANGVRDPGEPGLPGWTIRLYFNGHYVTSTTTGAGGAYTFHLDADAHPEIGEGTYSVKEETKAGWHQSQAPGSIFIHYGAGDTPYNGRNFGNWRPAKVSGHKYDDSNVSGTWDPGESPLEGWHIHLSNGDEATTGADGGYSFSVEPGTYTVRELLQPGWRQTAPGGAGARGLTLTSGQVVEGVDFGNVCLGGVAVEPVDDSTETPVTGMEVRLEEVSVPGILENEPSLPLTTSETPDFGGLLPGTYRVVAFLPEGVFTADPDVALVEGRFAIVREVTVGECETTTLPLHVFTGSTPGTVTGSGIRIDGPGGFATSGFEFMTRNGAASGTLEYQDHSTGLELHTDSIDALRVAGEVAWVWGRVAVEGVEQRFLLRLVDAGEPGREDRFELWVAPGYEAGQGAPITGGNVQIH